MRSHSILILMMFANAQGKYEVQEAKLGDRVTLQVEPDVKEWMRVKRDGTKEYVQYCNGTIGLGCSMFADENGTYSCPSSSVTVFPNGTLTLHFLWQGDAFANYSSRDATPENNRTNIYLKMVWPKRQ